MENSVPNQCEFNPYWMVKIVNYIKSSYKPSIGNSDNEIKTTWEHSHTNNHKSFEACNGMTWVVAKKWRGYRFPQEMILSRINSIKKVTKSDLQFTRCWRIFGARFLSSCWCSSTWMYTVLQRWWSVRSLSKSKGFG